jgi:hypothetical protein
MGSRRRHSTRTFDRWQTVLGLSLVTLGMAFLVPLCWTGAGEPWSQLWLAALVISTIGLLLLAPLLTGSVIVVLSISVAAVAASGLVRVGLDIVASDEEEAVREIATRLRFRIDDVERSLIEQTRNDRSTEGLDDIPSFTTVVTNLCIDANGIPSGQAFWTCEAPNGRVEKESTADSAVAPPSGAGQDDRDGGNDGRPSPTSDDQQIERKEDAERGVWSLTREIGEEWRSITTGLIRPLGLGGLDVGAEDADNDTRGGISNEEATVSSQPRPLAVAWAAAELAVAELELSAAIGTDSEAVSRAAFDAARAALQSQTTYEIDLLGAIGAAGSRVAQDVLPGNARVPLVIGVAGWFLLVAASYLLLRWGALLNATRGLGPVSLDPLDEGDPVWIAHRQQFHTCLLENVPEPGAVPHADALIQVASLIGTALPGASAASKSIQMARDVIFVPRGYTVQVGVIHCAETMQGRDPKASGIVVRIRKSRTKTLMDQRTFDFNGPAGEEQILAMRSAAYWAASVVVQASRSVPAWARWSPEAVAPLATLEASTTNDVSRAIELLDKALSLSPSSGMLLYKLALQYELPHKEAARPAKGAPNGETADGNRETPMPSAAKSEEGDSELSKNLMLALTCNLYAASLYPRYLDVRYRLATEASMLAGEIEEGGYDQTDAKRCSLAAYRYLGKGELTKLLNDYPFDGDREAEDRKAELRRLLLDLSLRERWRLRCLLSVPALLVNSLRSSERDLWLHLLRHRRERRDRRRRLAAAQVVTRERRKAAGLPKSRSVLLAAYDACWWVGEAQRRRLERLARRGDALWQLPYNLACYHALLAVREEGAKTTEKSDIARLRAREFLECARMSRLNEQLTREWLKSDPDLKGVRSADWWADLVKRFRAVETSSGGVARTAQTVRVPVQHVANLYRPEGGAVVGLDQEASFAALFFGSRGRRLRGRRPSDRVL